MTPRVRGTLAAMCSAVGFGMMPFLALQVYDCGGNPVFLVFCRFFFSLPPLFFLGRLWERKKASPPVGPFWGITLAFGATPLLMFLSYQWIPSSLTTAIHFTYPALVLLLCRILFRQRTTRSGYVCCAVCVVGVSLFCTAGSDVHPTGILLALGSAVTYGLYASWLPFSGLQKVYSPFQLTFRMNLVSACLTAILNTCMGTWAFDTLTLPGWGYTLLLSWGTAVFATVLFQISVRLCGAQYAALFSTLEPASSVVMGVLFLQESLTVPAMVGVGMILLAVLFLSVSQKSPEALSQAPQSKS